MMKKYLVSEDNFSGQVVIVCETTKEMVDTYEPTAWELQAAQYLYSELPKKMEEKTRYSIKVYYHYELGENAHNLLQNWTTFDKNEANEFFKQAINFTK